MTDCLSTLPVELQLTIFSLLSPSPTSTSREGSLEHSLLKLRAVSRLFNTLITPLAIHKHEIAIAQPRRHSEQHWHPILVPETLINYISTLKIVLTNFYVAPDDPGLNCYWNELGRLRVVENLEVLWAEDGGALVLQGPLKGTSRLLDDALEAVFFAKGNNNLRSLSFHGPVWDKNGFKKFPSSLITIRGLEELKLYVGCSPQDEGRGCEGSSKLPRQISRLIDHNPGIEVLHLSNLCAKHSVAFHNFLTLKRIKDLSISGDLVLKSSTALHQGAIRPFTRLQHLQVMSAAHTDALWEALRASRIELKTLHTDSHVSLSLLNYLSSFGSLESLTLELDDILPERSRHIITSTRLRSSIEPHAWTLQHLAIKKKHIHLAIFPRPVEILQYYADLSLDPSAGIQHQWLTPSSFRVLRSLHVPSPPSLALSRENCQKMLDFFSQFPVLRSAKVDWLQQCVGGWQPRARFSAFEGLGGRPFESSTGRPEEFSVMGARAKRCYEIVTRHRR